ncbi:hypothetical protein AOLI_G00061500 [Acnodon oligacanthus]
MERNAFAPPPPLHWPSLPRVDTPTQAYEYAMRSPRASRPPRTLLRSRRERAGQFGIKSARSRTTTPLEHALVDVGRTCACLGRLVAELRGHYVIARLRWSPPVSQHSPSALQRIDKEKRENRVGFAQNIASKIAVERKG